jgi:lipopolysaccharide transport system permease protein
VFAGAMAFYRFVPSWQIVFAPFLALLTVVASLGVVYLLSALTVTYRDFRYIIPIMIQLLMYLSPVVYSVRLVPEKYQWLLGVNPMAGIIDGFRSSILGKPWNFPILLTSIASTFLILLLGGIYFRNTERRFADIA